MKKNLQKVMAAFILVLVAAVSMAIAVAILNMASYCFDLAGMPYGWARNIALLACSVTVALDIAVWAEINLISLVAKTHVCDVWRDCTINNVKPCLLPFSVIRKIVKEW